jgi:hypothetical protein
MKYIATQYFTKASENFKPYNEGDEIELNKEDAERMLGAGLVKAKRKPKAKK